MPGPDPPPLAGWWIRVAATLLDALVFLVVVAAIGGLLVGAGEAIAAGAGRTTLSARGDEDLTWVPVLMVLAAVPLAFGGFALVMRPGGGRTPGKAVAGLDVVRLTGQPATYGRQVLRELVLKWLLFYWVAGQCFVPWLLDVLWPLWDDRRQSLHDKMAETVVVRRTR